MQSNRFSNVSPSIRLGPALSKVIPNIFKVNLIITLGFNSFIAIMPKLSK